MQQRMNAGLARARFAVIGKNARHVLPFLSQAGARSVLFYESYDSFDGRDGFDAIFISDLNHVRACISSKTDQLKAIGLISVDQVTPAVKELISSVPLYSATTNCVRSVSEYVIASIFLALRNVSGMQINSRLSYEVKGKTLGIVGYGKVGVQVSVLAESLGMSVIFYDSDMKLNIGNARQVFDLTDLLSSSDVVLLSASPCERAILTGSELLSLKPGASLINISGYQAIEIDPLVTLLQDQQINFFVMDLDAVISVEEASKIRGKLSASGNVCLTRGELCRTAESLKKISKDIVEEVLEALANNQGQSGNPSVSDEVSLLSG